jgi:nucleoside-diphosphate-sugar epimerase
MKNVLVTGAEGFTGRYIVTFLKNAGYQVTSLVRHSSDEGTLSCDLTNKENVFDVIQSVSPDAIIHLAAISFVGHDDLSEFYNINLFGTLNLLDAVRLHAKDCRVVLASSANIYGEQGHKPIVEQSCPNPVNHYAMSKLAMEHMAKLYFEDLNIIVTRPFNYIGPGQDSKFVIPKIVSAFSKGERILELGNVNVSRDFSDVRDIANYYVKLMESSVKSEFVNLCSGMVYSLLDIINYLERICSYKMEITVNQKFVRANDIIMLKGSTKKLNLIVGDYEKIPLDKTLTDMLSS